MNRNGMLLGDIIEMLSASHEVLDTHIAGNGIGRFARPTVDGVAVSLYHDDVKSTTVRVIVWRGARSGSILAESEIRDPFDGELVAEFIGAVLERMMIVEVQS